MTDSATERQIAETMVEVLRERLEELKALDAAGAAPQGTGKRLALVQKLLGHLEGKFGLPPPRQFSVLR